jgi:hypothetical protein
MKVLLFGASDARSRERKFAAGVIENAEIRELAERFAP